MTWLGLPALLWAVVLAAAIVLLTMLGVCLYLTRGLRQSDHETAVLELTDCIDLPAAHRPPEARASAECPVGVSSQTLPARWVRSPRRPF